MHSLSPFNAHGPCLLIDKLEIAQNFSLQCLNIVDSCQVIWKFTHLAPVEDHFAGGFIFLEHQGLLSHHSVSIRNVPFSIFILLLATIGPLAQEEVAQRCMNSNPF